MSHASSCESIKEDFNVEHHSRFLRDRERVSGGQRAPGRLALVVTFLGLLTIGLMAIFGLTAAARAAEPPVVRVRYQGLDLTRPDGRAVLERRVARAARRICGGSDGVLEHTQKLAARKCEAATVADATQQVERATRLAHSRARMAAMGRSR